MILRFFNQREQEAVRQALEGLANPVQLVLFTSARNAEYGEIISGLLGELAALHELLSLEVCDLEVDVALAATLGISRAPAIVVLDGWSRADRGIRFYGLPGGYLFPALLEALLMVGGASTSSLQPATLAFLKGLSDPLHLKVFVTANSYDCLPAVLLAYQLALGGSKVTAAAVEFLAFPELASRHVVKQLPTFVIGERVRIEGIALESRLLEILHEAVNPRLSGARIFYIYGGERFDELPHV